MKQARRLDSLRYITSRALNLEPSRTRRRRGQQTDMLVARPILHQRRRANQNALRSIREMNPARFHQSINCSYGLKANRSRQLRRHHHHRGRTLDTPSVRTERSSSGGQRVPTTIPEVMVGITTLRIDPGRRTKGRGRRQGLAQDRDECGFSGFHFTSASVGIIRVNLATFDAESTNLAG